VKLNHSPRKSSIRDIAAIAAQQDAVPMHQSLPRAAHPFSYDL
jgi:hypothetical protein